MVLWYNNYIMSKYTSVLLTKKTHEYLWDNHYSIEMYMRNRCIANNVPVERFTIDQMISFLITFWNTHKDQPDSILNNEEDDDEYKYGSQEMPKPLGLRSGEPRPL